MKPKPQIPSHYLRTLTCAATLPICLSLLVTSGLRAESQPSAKKAPVTITVEKSGRTLKTPTASLPYQTGQSGLYVASTPDSSAKLDAANGNVYALAINTQGVTRAVSVVHVNGRTLLVADPSRYKEKVAKSTLTPPAPPVAVASVTPAAK